ncbi:HupE/UreJ family protein [Acidovorax sp. NCPPB 2350]|nr:HupE/UreJ family protein [Acidovorax sp. NCPPB 2350]
MKKEAKHLSAAAAVLLALAPALAFAHVGDGTAHGHAGFLQGFAHPFTGLDHLAAMLALGVWSALAVRPVWLAPAAFVALLTVGAVAGFAGLAVPGVEPMIAASLLAVGLLVAWRRALPVALAAAIAGAFAFFHGAAHGQELGGGGQWLALAGMVAATALLHGAGIVLGRVVLQRHRALSLVAGGGTALLGAVMLARMA